MPLTRNQGEHCKTSGVLGGGRSYEGARPTGHAAGYSVAYDHRKAHGWSLASAAGADRRARFTCRGLCPFRKGDRSHGGAPSNRERGKPSVTAAPFRCAVAASPAAYTVHHETRNRV